METNETNKGKYNNFLKKKKIDLEK